MSSKGLRIPTTQEVAALSPEDQAAMAAAYLRGLETTSKLHLELFVEVARLMVLSTVELVPLRDNPHSQEAEVLLTKRPDTDPWWRGQWHVPGTVIFPTDEVPLDEEIDFENEEFDPLASYASPIDRIIRGELEDSIRIVGGVRRLNLQEARYRRGKRGSESTVILWANVETTDGPEPSVGQFFPVAEISHSPPPGGLIVGHAGLIERIAATYAAHKGNPIA